MEPAKRKTMVIVEDDPFISTMYQTKFEQSGYNVELINNGHDAYEAVRMHHPSVVILDINLPEMSGLSVLQAIKREGFDTDTTPVLVLTNSAEVKDRELAEQLGATFMVKSEVTPKEILEVIESKLKD